MANTLTHFAIYIDDMDRAKNFYNQVFQWEYSNYGPPDFFQIKSHSGEDAQLLGALQPRHYSPIQEKVIGYECTIQVEDVDVVAQAVEANGGTIVLPKTTIPQVGAIIKFQDTEGNLVCAMQYEHNINR